MFIRNKGLKLTFSFCFILSSSFIYGQDFFVLAENELLQNVIYKVKEKYQVQISANADLLDSCIITSNKKHQNLESLLDFLLKQCSLTYVKRKGVFIIKKKVYKIQKEKLYSYKFQFIDEETQESLPFSNVQIENTSLISDLDGNLSFVTNKRSLNIKVSHLAYHRIDTTILHKRTKLILTLRTNIFDIKTVKITSQKIPNQLVVGNRPGLIKVNHILAKQLPGNNNNTIFNILRLQPGILAAGEPSKDFIIRGAYKGQSQILFDGITIFNTSNFDDRVSVFNPLIIKDIQVYKSGYQVDIGDRVAGVVGITSKNGSAEKYRFGINLSNQTLGAYVNIPVKKKSQFQIAFRNVYPDIFKLSSFGGQNLFINNLFTDLNLKFVSNFRNNNVFKLSILGQRNEQIENEIEENNLRKYILDRNTIQYQIGASAQYIKKWKKYGNTNFTIAYSMLNTDANNRIVYLEKLNVSNSDFENSDIKNSASEFSFKAEHQFPSAKIQDIKMGVAYVYNETNYEQDSLGFVLKNTNNILSRISMFARDNLSITKYLNIIAGLKVDYAFGDKFPFFQPRIQAIVKPDEHWKINLAYGIYKQFLEENTFLDRFNNRIYFWDIQDNKNSRRLGAMHYVLGLSANYKYVCFSVEAYYRNTNNFDQLATDLKTDKIYLQEVKARTYGADFYVKGQYKKHILWLAYTISKSEESNFKANAFTPSDQDQRHEFKTAVILKFKSIAISSNYVFGSGFLGLSSYNRLDFALSYTKKMKRLKLELGASVLNVTNTKNIRYSNFSNFPNNKTIYSSALGITPNLFLNLFF